jgi:hypothetical protein
MIRRRVTVLGATGSVGCSTLDLMDRGARTAGTRAFEVEALTGGANIADWPSRRGAGGPGWRSRPIRPGWTNCARRWPERGLKSPRAIRR